MHRGVRFMSSALLSLALGFYLGCGGGGSSSAAPAATQDISAALQGVQGVSGVTEVASTIQGTRFFRFTFSQPADHTASGGPTFQQRVTLLYRTNTAPVVLATTGYGISQNPGQGEPTRLFAANQITMEHRFFNSSTPSSFDWSVLTVAQAAADQHRLVVALKPLFSGRWLSSGASKGGLTALFHRRFYPADVDATLAYVAPLTFAISDARYPPFIESRGNNATRLAIEGWQQEMLNRRAEMRALLLADAASQGEVFTLLDPDKTLEFAVLEAPFAIWQYGNATLAAQAPPAGSPSQVLYDYFRTVYLGSVAAFWADSALNYFQAYFQQTANQLGYPANKESHLTGLNYPGQDVPANYPPFGANKTHDGGAAMQDIQTWISNSAQNVILVYGENDPWSAGAADVPAPAQARGVRRFDAPGGNHRSNLASLAPSDNAAALALLSQWLGAPLAPAAAAKAPPTTATQEEITDTFLLLRPVR